MFLTGRILFIAVASILLVFGTAWAQEPERVMPGLNEAYLARDDGSGAAGERAKTFRTTDVPIHCVITLNTQHAQQVKINFIAVKVAGVRPDTRVVSASYNTKPGQTSVNFTGRPEGKWMPGAYRVDVFIDGKMRRALDMTVEGGQTAEPARYFAPQTEKKPPRKLGRPNKNPGQPDPGLHY